jgi:hypothetical protein
MDKEISDFLAAAKKSKNVELSVELLDSTDELDYQLPVLIKISMDGKDTFIPTGILMEEECFSRICREGAAQGSALYPALLEIQRKVAELENYLCRSHVYQTNELIQEIVAGDFVNMGSIGFQVPTLGSTILTPWQQELVNRL